MSDKKIINLFSIRYHPLILRQERAALILSRTRLVALILMMLMVFWIPIDIIMISGSQVKTIIFSRCISAIVFSGLIFYRPRIISLTAAFTSLFFLLAIPMVFYWYANIGLRGLSTLSPENAFVKTSYINFSILVTMLITLFPLTVVEAGILGLGLVFATAFVLIETDGLDNCGVLWCGLLWLDMAITGIAVIASMSQLHFMMRFIEYASQDRMTGMLKRDYGLHLMENMFLLAKENNTPLSMVFVDLDDFKGVNDRYGHDAGDNVLREAARRLKEVVGERGICVRWGGEEFILLLPKFRMSDIKTAVEHLRIEGLGLRPDYRVQTTSMGVSEYLEDEANTLPDLITLADRRMYEAKKAGKNTVVLKSSRFCFSAPSAA